MLMIWVEGRCSKMMDNKGQMISLRDKSMLYKKSQGIRGCSGRRVNVSSYSAIWTVSRSRVSMKSKRKIFITKLKQMDSTFINMRRISNNSMRGKIGKRKSIGLTSILIIEILWDNMINNMMFTSWKLLKDTIIIEMEMEIKIEIKSDGKFHL